MCDVRPVVWVDRGDGSLVFSNDFLTEAFPHNSEASDIR